MAYTAAGKRKMNWKMAAACSAALPALIVGGSRIVLADTTGNAGGYVSGAAVLQAMGFQSGYANPNGANPPTGIDYSGTQYGYVRNEYIGVVQGGGGSYTVAYGGSLPSISHQSAGMLSFGNTGGSLVYNSDELGPLNGLNFSDISSNSGGQNVGYGVWPLASRWTNGTVGPYTNYGYDYSAYTRALVDTTIVNVVGSDTATVLQNPTYLNGVLSSQFLLLAGTNNNNGSTTAATGVILTQEISLYRSTARIHWRITNTDSTPHTATLKFVVPIRASASDTGSSTTGQQYFNTGFYFQDPNRGVSNLVTLFSQGNVPNQLNVYGRRYETDSANTLSSTNPPFAARHTFRTTNTGASSATPPSQVYVTDPSELNPAVAGTTVNFQPGILNPQPGYSPQLVRGIATASYFGPYSLGPGQSQDIITYYGNGTADERLEDDFVTATEATESLAFNSAAALNAGVVGNRNATDTTVGAQFLAPNPITVYGGVYNRVSSTPLTSVNLTGVSAALVLPPGLQLASGETSQKTLSNGTVLSDKNAVTSWSVVPDGTAFGALRYLVTVNTNEFGARTIPRFINVPATPLHAVTANSFQMIGFPFQFDPVLSNNGDPATVVNDLTAPTDEPVAFYRWVPDATSITGITGSYQLVNQLQTGIGYFYRPNLNRVIFAKGVQPFPGQATTGADFFDTSVFNGGTTTVPGITQQQIILERGWNMISNPYLYQIPLNYLRFVTTDSTNNPAADSQTFQAAVNSGLVRGGVFFYNVNTKSYDFFNDITSPLQPWQGYWLFVNSRVALVYTNPTQRNSVVLPIDDPTLPIEPPTRSRKNTVVSAMVPRAKIWGQLESGRGVQIANPTPENWKLQLVATKQNGTTDKATIIGISPTSRDVATAAQNLPKPPPPFADYVYLGIVRDDAKTRFAQDIKGPNSNKTWTVEVEADSDGPVTVQWPNVARLPKRVALSVKDQTTGAAYSLSSRSSLVVNLKKGQTTRLVFSAKNQNSQSLSLSNVRAVSGGRAMGGAVKIAFDLSQDAQVTGVIKTLDGRIIETMAVGRGFSSGAQSLNWTGRAANGGAVPAGGYQAVLTAKDDTTTVTRIIPIQTVR